MNRAAMAARLFLIVALLPAIGAAGYAAYEYRSQPQQHFRLYQADPLVGTPTREGFLLGAYTPTLSVPTKEEWRAAALKQAAPDQETTALRSFNLATSCTAALSVRPVNWGSVFPAGYVASAARRGAETVIQLMPKNKNAPTLRQIASGKQDKYLTSFAKLIRKLKDHIYISFAPEMNGVWYQYGFTHAPAAEYVKAFRHVHEIIRAIAHRYVKWLWQPSAMHERFDAVGKKISGTHNPKAYWPGKAYVDQVGLDGYYYYTGDTFDVIFGPTITLLKALIPKNVPIMIGEVAAGTGHGFGIPQQVNQIKNLFSGIKKYHLNGLIWFDRNQLTKKYAVGLGRFHLNWMLDKSPKAAAAFHDQVAKLATVKPMESFLKHQKTC